LGAGTGLSGLLACAREEHAIPQMRDYEAGIFKRAVYKIDPREIWVQGRDLKPRYC